ncbi:MAG: hypothetical protein E7774_02795 [Bradyrhizobium sp.]|nr:MAG: hypothetical protein E7774_02795 [Bradyrhizobium sp.]
MTKEQNKNIVAGYQSCSGRMDLSSIQMFRLSRRGLGGLACDETGVALGAAELVRADVDAMGRRRCETLPPTTLGRILDAAYGPRPEAVVLRLHRALGRAARALEAGDLCLAGIEAVLLRLPDPTREALEKLAEFARLEKWGTAWQNQPRLPAGQTGGGQWTTEDSADAPVVGAKPAMLRADQNQAPRVDDGVYRPASDDAHVTLTGGAEEDEPSRRSNGPPDDYTRLEDVFPGLRDAPAAGIPLMPVDHFLSFSAMSDEAELEGAEGQYYGRIADIKRIDPSFVDNTLLPEKGFAALDWQGRADVINGLRLQLAATKYRMLGDIGPLQVQTLRFLQGAVDKAYAEAVSAADAGRLEPRLSRAQAIGDAIDRAVRKELRQEFALDSVPYGPRQNVTINNRDHETTETGASYRIPDARLGDAAYDWSLTYKTIGDSQIRAFFRADSQPRAVIIIRPSELGGFYLIPRPTDDWLYRGLWSGI